MAYTQIGLAPDGSSTWFLPRLVGTRRSLELMLTNRTLSAEEALAWGLVNRVVPAAALLGEAEALARELAAGRHGRLRRGEAPAAPLRRARGSRRRWSRRRARSPTPRAAADGSEGIAAFLAKRAPRFEGR